MRLTLTFIVCCFLLNLNAQSDSISKKNAYVLGFLPSSKTAIFGLALGLVGSEALCYVPHEKKSHGINLQLGQGFFTLYYPTYFNEGDTSRMDSVFTYRPQENYIRTTHNGLLISAFGTWTPVTNGVAISGLASMGGRMNGLAMNPVLAKYVQLKGVSIAIFNQSLEVKGVQVGLVNRTTQLRGFQIGLWNVNKKRRLPFINWSFK